MTPEQREIKVAEGLGRIKESYDNIKSAYNQDKLKDVPKEDQRDIKIAEGLGLVKESYNDIKSVYA